MHGFKPDWFIAGGWAIDLYIGKQTREHSDIEIAIFREDQLVLQEYLKDQNRKKVVNGKLSKWEKDEFLELPIHEIHSDGFEILLNERNESEWIYRRDARIRYPLNKFSLRIDDVLKILSPEIVLLYKSKDVKEKDDLDFESVLEKLKKERKEWLRASIKLSDENHKWLEKLK